MESIRRKKVPNGGSPNPCRNNNYIGEELASAGSNAKADDGFDPDCAGDETSKIKLKGMLKIGTWNIRTAANGTLEASQNTASQEC